MKVQVIHAAIEETARRCHPRLGAVLEQKTWLCVFDNSDFQRHCNGLLAQQKSGWLSKATQSAPSPADYTALAERHVNAITQWAKWPSIRALFHCLDAEAALGELIDGPFLSELTSDLVLEELQDQVDRGYLTL